MKENFYKKRNDWIKKKNTTYLTNLGRREHCQSNTIILRRYILIYKYLYGMLNSSSKYYSVLLI